VKERVMIYEERQCRGCGGELETILDLGTLALSTFLNVGDLLPQQVPLDLCACCQCTLVQLRHTTHPDLMFRQYWYLSSINETMRDELADIVAKARQIVTLEPGDKVIDIGANDGTLLAAYTEDVTRIGYEPALNLQETLKSRVDLAVPDYFPGDYPVLGHGAKVITSIAMFYDLDDPQKFVEAIAATLHSDGVWIVQFQDLDQMIKATAFDNICHEHLIYYSLETFEDLISYHGLKVVKAEKRAINGGSYRLYVRWSNHATDPSVDALRQLESGCQDWATFYNFAWRAQMVQTQIKSVVDHLQSVGKVVDIYGASTKFNTIAQCCAITGNNVRQAWERSPAKFGLHTVTGIPIVDEVAGRLDPPDALLVGIWQFRESILHRERSYLDQDPRHALIFPLPHVEVVVGDMDHGH
jgi:NDP-4-keto-2,6-dideoxyhexose 3-C-methyltransferase